MTNEELKGWMDQRFRDFELLLQQQKEDHCDRIEKLETDVKTHDRWLHIGKGVVLAIGASLSYLGFKIKGM